jgi:NADH-quinone oxidoreductase subunit M
MLGFSIAFAVKLPVIPFHTWLPDAHTDAPTAGSVVLAGLLLKTGGYGFLRFVLPLFPSSAAAIAPIAMALGVVGILYGSIMAFAQTDLKRMVAYTSVSHLGFVLLGIFSGSELALQGAVIQMICHGLSTGALFVFVGVIQERTHTRDIRQMGGFLSFAPKLSGAGMFFCLASMGLPGLGNFVGEFLILLGTYRVSVTLTGIAAVGFVLSTVYSLWLVQSTLHGKPREGSGFMDLSFREIAIFGAMMLPLIWIGVYPQNLLNTAKGSLSEITRVFR